MNYQLYPAGKKGRSAVPIKRPTLAFVLLLWATRTSLAFRRTDRRNFDRRARHNNNSSSQILRRTVNVNIPSSPDGHLVTDPLPLTKDGEELNTRHWAGHLPASDDKQKYFFYWLFEPENPGPDTPLLIWLNGGPACSSMDGLFLENGPIQWTVVDGKYMLQQNPYSWHKAPAYTLYIDQPVGTGLSFTTNNLYPRNDEEVNIDFYYFLTSFLDFHADKFVTEGVVNRPVFFSGESHAGHYIPSMMNYILKKNNNDTSPMIPLGGAAIGNGWMDPIYQYAAAEAAYGHGLVDRAQLYSFAAEEQKCQSDIQHGKFGSDTCYSLLDDIVDQSFGKKSDFRVSSYDVRISERKDSPRKFPKGHTVTECYLGGHKLPSWEKDGVMDGAVKNTVLKAIHATAASDAGQTYEECTDPPYDALADQDGKGVVSDIVMVLQHHTKPWMLFFNGVEDLICNHVGNEKSLENLPWHGKNNWTESKRYAWLSTSSGKQADGFMKEFENLLFLKLLNAGHMAPMDLPEVTLKMMRIFMNGESFSTSLQNLGSSATNPPSSCPICDTCATQENEYTDSSVDCAEEVSKATAEALASIQVEKTGEAGYGPVILAVISVCSFSIYGVILYLRRKREEGENFHNHIEMPSQYHDST